MNYNQSYLIFLKRISIIIWCIYSLNFHIWFFSSCQKALCVFKLLLKSSRRRALSKIKRAGQERGTQLDSFVGSETGGVNQRAEMLNVKLSWGSTGPNGVLNVFCWCGGKKKDTFWRGTDHNRSLASEAVSLVPSPTTYTAFPEGCRSSCELNHVNW